MLTQSHAGPRCADQAPGCAAALGGRQLSCSLPWVKCGKPDPTGNPRTQRGSLGHHSRGADVPPGLFQERDLRSTPKRLTILFFPVSQGTSLKASNYQEPDYFCEMGKET